LSGDLSNETTNGVDAADYVVWRESLGAVGTALAADGNNSETVDAADYDMWRSNFGRHATGTASETVATVPEPSAEILLCVASLAVLCGTDPIGFSRRADFGADSRKVTRSA
jgi:hypothetical protein